MDQRRSYNKSEYGIPSTITTVPNQGVLFLPIILTHEAAMNTISGKRTDEVPMNATGRQMESKEAAAAAKVVWMTMMAIILNSRQIQSAG
jgi:hypothetical protein